MRSWSQIAVGPHDEVSSPYKNMNVDCINGVTIINPDDSCGAPGYTTGSILNDATHLILKARGS